MATIAVPRLIEPHRSPSTIAPLSPIALDAIDAQATCTRGPSPVPNKHLPLCPPGSLPREDLDTPPPSPGREKSPVPQRSLLYPPNKYPRLELDRSVVYQIKPSELADALVFLSQQPMPDPSCVFPWFHGLHVQNHIQQAFFASRTRASTKTPGCLRGITVVKADGNLSASRLKGSIAPSEFLECGPDAEFLDVDPKEGFSVRNFQIQAAKSATTSDIVIYGDDDAVVRALGWDVSYAQRRWREKHEAQGHRLPTYNTFICTSPFKDFESGHPELVAVDSAGRLTGNVIDLLVREKEEMHQTAQMSEISHNVWLGPTPNAQSEDDRRFDLLIECSDVGRLNPAILKAIAESSTPPRHLDFPSSGSILAPSWSHVEADGILETCKWIWHLSHGTRPSAKDGQSESTVPSRKPLKILIHCADGYTESSLLGIAYYSYSTGRAIPDAFVDLHCKAKRNFFAYSTDVALLAAVGRLLPRCAEKRPSETTVLVRKEPAWMAALDGSLPSRVLDYMYLGNLGHANNPGLLKALGINQILSVGETAMWRDGELEDWGVDNTCTVQGVQDNGIDSLTDEFERCLDFIDRGRQRGTATLVHCRVGVSRSATICIAEVMRSLNMSLPRAYCFVRARRLNVIIQPHLRFTYELLKWEELLQRRRANDQTAGGTGIKREMEWAELAREVAHMNRPYSSR